MSDKSFTYAIGDAHGRFDLVLEAISAAERHAGNSSGRFIVCGDFIDRGPQSRQIIDLLMNGPSLNGWSWITLKGNHEDMMVQCLDRMQLDWWIGNGGGATLKSYGYSHGDPIAPLKVPNDHIEWLRELPVYHIDAHRAFVHAGFNPNLPLSAQSDQEMMWVRDPRGTDYSFLGRHVVHGHEQYADGPILTPNKTNLDIFAWRFGRLAMAVFDDEQPGPPVDILIVEKDASQ